MTPRTYKKLPLEIKEAAMTAMVDSGYIRYTASSMDVVNAVVAKFVDQGLKSPLTSFVGNITSALRAGKRLPRLEGNAAYVKLVKAVENARTDPTVTPKMGQLSKEKTAVQNPIGINATDVTPKLSARPSIRPPRGSVVKKAAKKIVGTPKTPVSAGSNADVVKKGHGRPKKVNVANSTGNKASRAPNNYPPSLGRSNMGVVPMTDTPKRTAKKGPRKATVTLKRGSIAPPPAPIATVAPKIQKGAKDPYGPNTRTRRSGVSSTPAPAKPRVVSGVSDAVMRAIQTRMTRVFEERLDEFYERTVVPSMRNLIHEAFPAAARPAPEVVQRLLFRDSSAQDQPAAEIVERRPVVDVPQPAVDAPDVPADHDGNPVDGHFETLINNQEILLNRVNWLSNYLVHQNGGGNDARDQEAVVVANAQLQQENAEQEVEVKPHLLETNASRHAPAN